MNEGIHLDLDTRSSRRRSIIVIVVVIGSHTSWLTCKFADQS